jgi:glycerol-3-phosphate acyltransferase PlsY
MSWIISAILVSYLLGSIPNAYLFGRLLKGIDIRRFGSGNVGATNALRVLGKKVGIAVLILDMLKGLLASTLLADFILLKTKIVPAEALRIMLGAGSISGHNWSLFLNFKGGKGVATTIGVLLGLAIKIAQVKAAFILLLLTWLAVFFIFRIVSLASVVASIFLPIYMTICDTSRFLVISSAVLSIFIILRHRSNLSRLWHHEESRLTF